VPKQQIPKVEHHNRRRRVHEQLHEPLGGSTQTNGE
jgi:hypothetical protein